MAIEQSTAHHRYPRGLLAIFFMQLTSMIGFMFIFSMTTLYCTQQLGLEDKAAYTLFAAYGAVVYGMPLFGGFLGDRFFGHKFAVLFATIACGVALILIALPFKMAFISGLACFAIATCVQVPNLYCLIGQLYDKNDERRHSGFTLAYVGMNVGAFVAAASSGYLSHHFGFRGTYLIGALAMFLTLIAYYLGHKNFSDGFIAAERTSVTTYFDVKKRALGALLFLLALPLCTLAFHYPEQCNLFILFVGVVTALFIFFKAFRYSPLQRYKIWVFLALTCVSIGWGVLYMMAPTVLTLFIERNVDRHLWQSLIPTSSVISLNAFFVIILGPLLSALWIWLTLRHKNPSGAFKLSVGVIVMGLGYLALVPGIHFANALGYSAFGWIVLSYFLQTLGELLVNPVGYALVGSLAPPRQEGFLMGFFQLGSGVASVLMGYIAGTTSQTHVVTSPLQTNALYAHSFNEFGLYSIAIGSVALLFSPYFAKIIRAKIVS